MRKRYFRARSAGFTLIEILIAFGIATSLIVGLLSVYLTCGRSWHRASLAIDTTREANRCLDQMVYGVGTNMGLRSCSWVTNTGSASDWVLRASNFNGVAWYDYNPAQTTVVYSNAAGRLVIGTNIVASTVTATGSGVGITLTVQKSDGQFTGSGTMSTFVKLRTAMMR